MSPGWWVRLANWAQRGSAPEDPGPPPPVPAPEGPARPPPGVAWLVELAAAVAERSRADEVGSTEFWERIDGLRDRGHELLAVQWLEKFLAIEATPDAVRTPLRLRIAEWLIDRGDFGQALPHIERLAEVPEHSTKANYWLGEHYRRTGDEVRALRHYEAVLARDVDYLNVRARVERIRTARGRGRGMMGGAGGETIAGAAGFGAGAGARYRLVRELGRGATGVVYMARDMELERDVAVKLLHPHLAAARQAEACARFFNEARIAASLRHPNILAVLDIDEAARRMVMELAAGGTLREVLRDRGARTPRRALERHAQVLSALAAAHRRGIIHRDLKPGNLMFRRDPDAAGAEIVLGDFGIAHLPNPDRDTSEEAATSGRFAIGTLAYMAPEQRRGQATPRSDVYAAAVVLFEMLIGEIPWDRSTLLSGVRRREDFALPPALSDQLPERLRSLLREHLLSIGEPEVGRRPDAETALRQARQLRDAAIASARE